MSVGSDGVSPDAGHFKMGAQGGRVLVIYPDTRKRMFPVAHQSQRLSKSFEAFRDLEPFAPIVVSPAAGHDARGISVHPVVESNRDVVTRNSVDGDEHSEISVQPRQRTRRLIVTIHLEHFPVLRCEATRDDFACNRFAREPSAKVDGIDQERNFSTKNLVAGVLPSTGL